MSTRQQDTQINTPQTTEASPEVKSDNYFEQVNKEFQKEILKGNIGKEAIEEIKQRNEVSFTSKVLSALKDPKEAYKWLKTSVILTLSGSWLGSILGVDKRLQEKKDEVMSTIEGAKQRLSDLDTEEAPTNLQEKTPEDEKINETNEYGEMIPAKDFFQERFNNFENNLRIGLEDDVIRHIKNNPQTSVIIALTAAEKIGMEKLLHLLKSSATMSFSLTTNMIAALSNVPGLAIDNPIKTALIILSVRKILIESENVYVPKDPKQFNRFIKDLLTKKKDDLDSKLLPIREKIEVLFEEYGININDFIQIISSPNFSLEELLIEAENESRKLPSLINNCFNFAIDALGETTEDTYKRKTRLVMKSSIRNLKAHLRSGLKEAEYNEEKFEKFANFMQILITKIESDINITEEDLSTLEKLIIELHPKLRIDRDSNFVKILDIDCPDDIHFNLMVEPTLPKNERIKRSRGLSPDKNISKEYLVIDPLRTGLSQEFMRFKEIFKSGNGLIMIKDGIVWGIESAYTVYLGPLEILEHIKNIPDIYNGDIHYNEVLYETAHTITPVIILSTVANIPAMLTKSKSKKFIAFNIINSPIRLPYSAFIGSYRNYIKHGLKSYSKTHRDILIRNLKYSPIPNFIREARNWTRKGFEIFNSKGTSKPISKFLDARVELNLFEKTKFNYSKRNHLENYNRLLDELLTYYDGRDRLGILSDLRFGDATDTKLITQKQIDTRFEALDEILDLSPEDLTNKIISDIIDKHKTAIQNADDPTHVARERPRREQMLQEKIKSFDELGNSVDKQAYLKALKDKETKLEIELKELYKKHKVNANTTQFPKEIIDKRAELRDIMAERAELSNRYLESPTAGKTNPDRRSKRQRARELKANGLEINRDKLKFLSIDNPKYKSIPTKKGWKGRFGKASLFTAAVIILPWLFSSEETEDTTAEDFWNKN